MEKKRTVIIATIVLLLAFISLATLNACGQTKAFASNIYDVTLNTCTGRELVIQFSAPIADKYRLLERKEDVSILTEQLKLAEFSKVYGLNVKTLVTVSNGSGIKDVRKAVKEILEILNGNSERPYNFISAGPVEKVFWPCRSPEWSY